MKDAHARISRRPVFGDGLRPTERRCAQRRTAGGRLGRLEKRSSVRPPPAQACRQAPRAPAALPPINTVRIFTAVIGPVIRGPSGSPCAAALPLPLKSQGSDRGLFGALLSWEADDPRLADSAPAAAGVTIGLATVDVGHPHPTTYRLTLCNDLEQHPLIASPTGGGGRMAVIRLGAVPMTGHGGYHETRLWPPKGPPPRFEADEVLGHDAGALPIVGVTAAHFIATAGLPAPAVKRLAPVLPVPSRQHLRVPFTSRAEMLAPDGATTPPLGPLAPPYERARGNFTAREVIDRIIGIGRILRRSLARGLAGTPYAGRLPDADTLDRIVRSGTALPEVKSSPDVIVAAPTDGACAALVARADAAKAVAAMMPRAYRAHPAVASPSPPPHSPSSAASADKKQRPAAPAAELAPDHRAMKHRVALLAAATLALGLSAADRPAPPTAHTTRDLEGWRVRVDEGLLSVDGAAPGRRALTLPDACLVTIAFVVPEPGLAKLRAVTIQLDLDYGELRPMQYHPSRGWLQAKGYSEALAKCVHIPSAAGFLAPFDIHRMPWVVLHELAHAYHDQVLGFDEPRLVAAWQQFRASGKYTSVLTSYGALREHYGLNNANEFFAELTGSCFGSNDFFPFVAGELNQAEPALFAPLAALGDPLPANDQPPRTPSP